MDATTNIKPKCVRCGIELTSYVDYGEGPLCSRCACPTITNSLIFEATPRTEASVLRSELATERAARKRAEAMLRRSARIISETQHILGHDKRESCNCDVCCWLSRYRAEYEKDVTP